MNREKVIRAFEQYVYNFIELTTTDEYNHQILEQVLVLLKEQEHKDRMFHALEDDWKRLKELLKEQEAMKECLKKKCVICPHCDNCDVDENGLLKEQEVVRCKDCKRFVPPHSCTHVGNFIDGDWFCADGVAKDINVPCKEGR